MYYSELVLSFRKRPFLRWVLCGVLILWGMRLGMQYVLVTRGDAILHLPVSLRHLTGMSYSPWNKDTTLVLLFEVEEPFYFAGKTWRTKVKCLNYGAQESILLYTLHAPPPRTKIACARIQLSVHAREDLYLQGIMARGFVLGEMRAVQTGNSILQESKVRMLEYWKHLFIRWRFTSEQRALCLAILLGDKSGLDAEVKRDFQSAGALHILAVSGMHVSILYALFTKLLFFMDRIKRRSLTKKILLSFLLIAYAWMCGFSHAIVRAVWVFCLPLWGNSTTRSADALNVLCFVALFQMAWEPAALFQVSFQLSYMAVASILIFEKGIRSRILWGLDPKKKFPFWVLPVSAVSMGLAANIGTLPLVALHFGKIPLYFMLTSVLTSFPSTVLLSGLVLAAPVTEIVPDAWVSYVMQIMIWIFIAPIEWIADLPFSQVTILHFGFWQCIAVLLAIVAIVAWQSKEQKARAAMLMLLSVILYMIA